MTPPRLEACYFVPPGRLEAAWTRLAAVLEATAGEHCPDWQIAVRRLPEPPRPPWRGTFSGGFIANTVKLGHWNDVVQAAKDGDRLLLMDADTLVMRALTPIWDQVFDVAYTVRPPTCRFPLNAGVVFVRVSEATRRFFARWVAENDVVLANAFATQPWRRKFGGLNQAALGKLLHGGGGDGLTVLEVPCLEWNCEDSTWAQFDPAVTRIVHIKSALRLAALGEGPFPAGTTRLAQAWRAKDRELQTRRSA